MEENNTHLIETARLIARDCDLEESELISSENFESLKEKVGRAVEWLLEHNFERLLSILYLMDVDEEQLKSQLRTYPDTDAHVLITNMIIERELKKVKTREEFKVEDEEDDADKW